PRIHPPTDPFALTRCEIASDVPSALSRRYSAPAAKATGPAQVEKGVPLMSAAATLWRVISLNRAVPLTNEFSDSDPSPNTSTGKQPLPGLFRVDRQTIFPVAGSTTASTASKNSFCLRLFGPNFRS